MLDLREEGVAAPRELGDPVAAASFGKVGFLRGELGGAQALVSIRQRRFSRFARRVGNVALRRFVVQARLQVGDLGGDRLLCFQLGIVLSRDVRGLFGDLRATPLRCLGRLLQLHQFKLEVVAAALLRSERKAFVVIRLLLLLQLEFDSIERRPRVRAGARRSGDCPGQLVQFPLARQHAVQLAIRRE